jgi:hypothetical protein
VVTLTVPITTTLALKNTLALQTIPTITVRTVAPQTGMEILPIQQQAYQEDQQAWICTRWIGTDLRATQCQHELTGEQTTLNAQLTDLQRRKAALGMD